METKSLYPEKLWELVLSFLRIVHVWAHYRNIITPSHSLERHRKIYLCLQIFSSCLFIWNINFLSHTARDTKHRIVRAQSKISRKRAMKMKKKSHRQCGRRPWRKEDEKKFLKSRRRKCCWRRETRPKRRKAAYWILKRRKVFDRAHHSCILLRFFFLLLSWSLLRTKRLEM